jgi:hypothetical protein
VVKALAVVTFFLLLLSFSVQSLFEFYLTQPCVSSLLPTTSSISQSLATPSFSKPPTSFVPLLPISVSSQLLPFFVNPPIIAILVASLFFLSLFRLSLLETSFL